jgi:hypothetical protein
MHGRKWLKGTVHQVSKIISQSTTNHMDRIDGKSTSVAFWSPAGCLRCIPVPSSRVRRETGREDSSYLLLLAGSQILEEPCMHTFRTSLQPSYQQSEMDHSNDKNQVHSDTTEFPLVEEHYATFHHDKLNEDTPPPSDGLAVDFKHDLHRGLKSRQIAMVYRRFQCLRLIGVDSYRRSHWYRSHYWNRR